MVAKNVKNIFERMDALKGKPGTIKMNDSDRDFFIGLEEKVIDKTSEKRENHIWLVIGLMFGLLGTFTVTLFYDWLKTKSNWTFMFMSSLLVILFLMIILILFFQLREHGQSIDFANERKKMWSNAKSINVGSVLKRNNNEEPKNLTNQK